MKTVILLRHADIDLVPGGAPDSHPLNALGKVRAAELAHVAGKAGVKAIYVSPAKRTKDTAAPLATALQLTPKQVPVSLPQFVSEVLSDAAGPVVLVVGHSNTVPDFITALGAMPPVAEVKGHDSLFVVTVPATGQAGLVWLKYGAPTP